MNWKCNSLLGGRWNVAIIFSLLLCFASSLAATEIYVNNPRIPILIERQDNILIEMKIDAADGDCLNALTLHFDESTPINEIASLRLYYSGNEPKETEGNHYRLIEYIDMRLVGRAYAANRSYSVLQSEQLAARTVTLTSRHQMEAGRNFFWVSIQMKPTASLLSKIMLQDLQLEVNGKPATAQWKLPPEPRRTGVGVRHAGDDASAWYRIPGLVTAKDGSLVAVYDIRHNRVNDLQEWVEIGCSRSTDKGQTWEPMRVAMSMANYGGMPAALNGIGDPSILVDNQTGTLWVAAAWVHGKRTDRQGLDIAGGATQLMLSRSDDNGKTWSEPRNITRMVKDSVWYNLLQGPGRGITMQDGTLVFPIQYIDDSKHGTAGIMYSRDHGETWQIDGAIPPEDANVPYQLESQVAEIKPGVLMLNVRNASGYRLIYTSNDLGKTWDWHPTSHRALQEEGCQASLIHVAANENVLGRDLLLFSNPNTQIRRDMLTIKASLDSGMTWPTEYHLLLDEERGEGYSCLTMIDKETVGILYESSTAMITFQAIPLRDIVK